MGLDALLLNKGYTLPGQDPNTSVDGGDPQAGVQRDMLHNLLRTTSAFITKQKIDDQEKQDKLKQQSSNYNTLRNAGYTPQQAHAAVRSGDLPKDVPGLDTKGAADVELTKAKTKLITNKADGVVPIGDKKSDVEGKILGKMSRGEELTTSEQKVYDDVIKKRNPQALLDSLLNPTENGAPAAPKAPVAQKEAMVPVTGPDGKPYKVPKSKLEAALKSGYKQR